MGIKLQLSAGSPTPGPGSTCDKVVEISSADSSGHSAPSFAESNVLDCKLDTIWMSEKTHDPMIWFELKMQKLVCRVDIAWAYTNVPDPRPPFKFRIETSLDNTNWVNVFPSGSSTVTTTELEGILLLLLMRNTLK